MQEKVNKITSLIEKFLEEQLTGDEERELNEWLAEAEHNRLFFQQITDKTILKEKLKLYAGTDSESIWKKTLQKVDGGKLVDLYPERKTIRLPFGKIAIAASVILLLSAGTWYYFNQPSHKELATTTTTTDNTLAKGAIVPGGNKAILTLADGRTIDLNSVQNGALENQGNAELTKAEGALTYSKKAETAADAEGLYNTVTTPKGGEYQVTLPDGSKVRLNAASSLRFPIAFAGSERIVELTGEAYFEVNPQHNTQVGADKPTRTPFIVKINTPEGHKDEVEVLGTHFNVMAYSEEAAIKTTLIEGAVKVTSGTTSKTIKPGEQAKLREGDISIQKVDAQDVIGWTNGFIPVGGPDLAYTMRQIARWYDLSIVYEGKRPEISFEGKLNRTSTIENVIKLLKANNIKVRLNEKERKLIVTS